MFTNPAAAQTLRYVREALTSTIAPELTSDKAKVVLAMIDTTLASVEKRIPVEQQYMADECNRMRALLRAAVARLQGVDSAAANDLRALWAALPEAEPFAPIPTFAEITSSYAAISELFTRSIGFLHDLAGEGLEAAPALITDARAYIALRLERDMQSVFAMEGGLLGKG